LVEITRPEPIELEHCWEVLPTWRLAAVNWPPAAAGVAR